MKTTLSMKLNAYTFNVKTNLGSRQTRALGVDEAEARSKVTNWKEEEEDSKRMIDVLVLEVNECTKTIKDFMPVSFLRQLDSRPPKQ
jgi:hypothetical protein